MNQSFAPALELDYQAQITHASEIIVNALHEKERPVVSTKFGIDSSVFLHFINQHVPGIPVLWVDTGYNSRATLDFVDNLVDLLALNVCVYKPIDHTIKIPPTLDDVEHKTFTQEVKLEPFQRALRSQQADVWFSSIRRYQTTHRERSHALQRLSGGLLKVSPILDWTAEIVQQYREAYALPLGPDCYDPTKGVAFRECGIHYLS